MDIIFSIAILLTLVKSFLVCAESKSGFTRNSPRIQSSNGNLQIIAAYDRNISFETQGKGVLNINGENILAILNKRMSTKNQLDFPVETINEIQTNFDRLKLIINGPQGVLRKLEMLEISNGTIIRNSTRDRLVTRRLNMLRRKISQIEMKVTALTHGLMDDDCLSNPCKNGGRCKDLYNDFFCMCPDNWEGPTCEIDVNECSRFAGTDLGCQNGATCINKPGTYECLCTSGWFGLHCTRKNSDCDSGPTQELCGHGICVSQRNTHGYACICEQGWKTDGVHPACIVDVDECSGGRFPCSTSPLVSCINLPGSFTCGLCPAGYTGNGYHCTDINECLENNGGCSITPFVPCINTIGSRKCGPCPVGFQGDGISCEQGEICSINNGGCHPLATCIRSSIIPTDKSSIVTCLCPDNYIGNGYGPTGCTPIDITNSTGSCSSKPCGSHGKCIPSGNSFRCQCDPLYSGPRCEQYESCTTLAPCKNGGTCIDIPSGYRCQCTKPFQGKNCENQKESCGGSLTGPSGVLSFPSSNSTEYKKQISCAWTITVDSDKVINITFSKFHLEEGPGCPYDWLQIHDGRNTAAHLIGRFCGNTPPKHGNIVSTHNVIYIWFRSDASIQHNGFQLSWNEVEPLCTSIEANKSHGILNSPGNPGNYPPNRDCYWVVIAPLGKRIQFQFFTLMIGNNPDCNSDYLEIFSGFSEEHTLIARYCNSSHPEPFLTPGAEALVHFHSDAETSYPGFQLTYTVVDGIPGCGGVYTAKIGEISAPTVDDQYLPNLNCEYQIIMPEGTRIRIRFLTLDIEDSKTCAFDFVEIRDGTLRTSTNPGKLVGRYCGNRAPPTWTSSTNHVYILFQSDWTYYGKGFRIKYEAVCGDLFTAPSGIITSPGYPLKYLSSQNCIYGISTVPGFVIKIDFVKFEIGRVKAVKESKQCDGDHLAVHDGDTENSTLIGKFCGSEEDVPASITSTHNHLYLYFQSDELSTGSGFILNYTTIDVGCGGILKNMVDTIQSPRESSKYPLNKMCQWIIMAPPGYVVQLTWITFTLEKSFNCSADYVVVYDNITSSQEGIALGKFCGSKLPPIIISSENMLTIQFRSDASKVADGFIANYLMRDESHVCGRPFYTTTGFIRSPGYPIGYPRSKDCVWTINVPVGQQIFLNITDFEIEAHKKCNFDYLEIRNGGYDTSPLIGKFCGKTIPASIFSLTNQLYLRFRSDASRSAKGFEIYWDASISGCGGTLSSVSGHIISPNYPQPYARNSECYWRIVISAGSVIQVVLFDIDLELNTLCNLDYIEFHNGVKLTNNPIGRYCSDNHPPSIKSESNKMLIKFRSDINFEGKGFSLKYSTLCKNELTGHIGVIESPNYPNNYPNNLDCEWTISIPRGNTLNITFSHFDVEKPIKPKDECSGDLMEIYERAEDDDGTDTPLNTITYCYGKPPKDFTSETNTVVIKFKSDNMISARGFRLEWIVNGCGGTLTESSGVITTPSYPNYYPQNTVCEWRINIDYASSIELTIYEMDIESLANCQFDGLDVYNGMDDTYPLLTQLCVRTTEKTVVTSSGSYMFLRFHSDGSFSGRGFNASYKQVPVECGGIFTTPTGFIHSRNYPKNYKNNDDCFWLITMPEHHLIQLSFMDFDTEAHKNCSKDYVKVFDGNTIDDPLLIHHCGNTLPQPPIIVSSDNTLLVHMKTDALFGAKGFKANFTIACGKRIKTESSGTIHLHDFTTTERDSSNCSWTIEATKPGDHVSFTFNYININDKILMNDEPELRLYDGFDDSAPLIGNFTTSKTPPTITSHGQALHILANLVDGFDFSASYSVINTACGGALESEMGEFGSLGYPENYPPNADCVWTLKPSLGNKVTLRFSRMEIEESDYCNTDFVEIRGDGPEGPLLGVYCGNNVPINETTWSSLWIRFKSDEEGTAKGFLASYNFIFGSELTGTEGRIQSPFYPRYYTDTEEYSWQIIGPQSKFIYIRFLDFFMDDLSGSGDFCFDRKLEIFDGVDENAPILLSACSHTIPDPVTSSTNYAFIRFHGTGFGAGGKFDLEWTAVNTNDNNNISVSAISNPNCEIESSNQTSTTDYYFRSPGFPNGYGSKLNCEWTFHTDYVNHIAIKFLTMHLERSPLCVSDYVTAFSSYFGAKNTEMTNLGKYCLPNATEIPPIHGGNILNLHFITDRLINGTGFEAHLYDVCGSHLYLPNGVIKMTFEILKKYIHKYDPKFPEVNCEWQITVRQGRVIRLVFEEFNVTSQDCNTYIMLKNGQTSDSPLLGAGKFCNSENALSEIPTTTSNQAYVKLKSSFRSLYTSGGFALRYEEVSKSCGDSIVLTSWIKTVNISSPNYPNIPDPRIECEWTIRAPPGDSITIDFIERFDITFSTNCKSEAVEIYNGGSINSPLIVRACDENNLSSYTSSENIVHVRYFNELDEPNNGFKAQISIATCGGTIRAAKGFIASPNYPLLGSVARGVQCTWKLIGTKKHGLDLNFKVISLPRSQNCTNVAHVTITEQLLGINDTNPETYILGNYCGSTDSNKTIQASGNQVEVTFDTMGKTWDHFRGFYLEFVSTQGQCGGTFVGSEGIITSPGYPLTQSRQLICKWIIKAPQGKRVKLEFLDLNLGTGEDRRFRTLNVYNDEKYNNLIVHIKQDDQVKEIKSSTNIMMIYAFWGIKLVGRRFKAKWTSDEASICGEINDQQKGVILPPPNVTQSYFCYWTFNINEEQTLSLTINPIQFQNQTIYSNNCLYEQSRIIVKDDDNNIIQAFCKDITSPTVVRSPITNTKLEIMRHSILSEFNYKIDYKIYSCGGIVRKGGIITSPGYPGPVVEDVQCVWLVQLAKGVQIKINSEYKLSCSDQSLIIKNGQRGTSPVLATLCGQSSDTIVSESNSLWIEYQSGKRNTSGNGFRITMEEVQNGCGGYFHQSRKNITSPGYPKDYAANVECEWIAEVPSGYHVGLTFIDAFQIEDSVNCSNDYVEIWDKVDNLWVSLGRVCGRSRRVFNSTTNLMKIKFRSNEKINGQGFKARWSENCGGTFAALENEQVIVSPGYPREYSPNLNCTYTIVAPKNYIQLWFNEFNVERVSDNCNADNVTLTYKQRPNRNDIVLGPYCNKKLPPNQIRSYEKIVVSFKTNSWLQSKGFSFSYRLDKCGGVIDSTSVIASPTESTTGKYHEDLKCTWNITAPEGKIIVVKFLNFLLERSHSCRYDYVALYDSDQIDDKQRLALLCGNLTLQPPVIQSTGQNMVVSFVSDMSSGYQGFRAIVFFTLGPESGCGGNVVLSENKLKTNIEFKRNIDGQYESFLDCHWSIKAPEDYTISVKFKTFNVTNCLGSNPFNLTSNSSLLVKDPNCNCNYLELYDGSGPFSEKILHHCGNIKPPLVMSSFNNLWMRFVSDATIDPKNTEFVAELEAKLSICGTRTLSASNVTQTLTSPNYPNNYPGNIRCIWVIKSQSNRIFQMDIRIDDLELEEGDQSGHCVNDRLEIFEKDEHSNFISEGLGRDIIWAGPKKISTFMRNRSPITKLTYCGSGKPFDYYSGSHTTMVALTTNSQVEKRGFKIKYQLLGCNRNYTGVQGRIYIRTDALNCTIVISAPKNHTISLYFQSFFLLDGASCKALIVYDGDSKKAPELARLCGLRTPSPLFSTGNVVLLRTESNQTNYFGTYDITYTTTDKGRGCGGELYNYGGKFTSPFYPGNYRNETTCEWKIATPTQTQLVLRFVYFNIGPKSTCTTDYLQIWEPSLNGEMTVLKTQLCGAEKPANFVFDGNEATVTYTTSKNNMGQGWEIVFFAKGFAQNLNGGNNRAFLRT